MSNRNYSKPSVSPEWANCRQTAMIVATAIHAIADSARSADAIWDDPTESECDHVKMAMQEYLTNGDFDANLSGAYSWGVETIRV
jgi:hypothetical protein